MMARAGAATASDEHRTARNERRPAQPVGDAPGPHFPPHGWSTPSRWPRSSEFESVVQTDRNVIGELRKRPSDGWTEAHNPYCSLTARRLASPRLRCSVGVGVCDASHQAKRGFSGWRRVPA